MVTTHKDNLNIMQCYSITISIFKSNRSYIMPLLYNIKHKTFAYCHGAPEQNTQSNRGGCAVITFIRKQQTSQPGQ